MIRLLEFRMKSDAICLGERKKKGTYRSSVHTIPYSQITGALEAAWGAGDDTHGRVHAVGVFKTPDPADAAAIAQHTETQVYARRDLAMGVAVLPIETRILTDVIGKVFVVANAFTEGQGRDAFEIHMGAYRQKGLGLCSLTFCQLHELDESAFVRGKLRTRLPERVAGLFGIGKVEQPAYGYLFWPDEARESGHYVRSLFEESVLTGPAVLVEPVQAV